MKKKWADKNNFANRLKFARLQLEGLTQKKLASMIEIPSTSISHFENSKELRLPTFSNIIKLSQALNVTSDYLLGLSDSFAKKIINNNALNLNERELGLLAELVWSYTFTIQGILGKAALKNPKFNFAKTLAKKFSKYIKIGESI